MYGDAVHVQGRRIHGRRGHTNKTGWCPRAGLMGTAEAPGTDRV
jgi:hypothetical protein